MPRTVRELFNEYMEHSDKSQAEVARSVGTSAATLSLWINEKYSGDVEKLELRMQSFLSREFTRQTYRVDETFVETSQARAITDVLNYCHTHQDMGAVYGVPGLGKSVSAVEYLKNHPDVILLTAFKGFTRTAIIVSIAQHLGMATQLTGYRQFQLIAKVMQGSDRMLILDEAQFLSSDSLEIVRSLHDQSGIGTVYFGQPRMQRMMAGKEAEFFAQISSRLGVVQTLTPPKFEDIELIARSYKVIDKKIHNYLWGIVNLDPWGGSYRKMSKLLKLAIRTASVEKQEITIPFLKDVGRYMVYTN